jgi:hypothetical protein
MLEAKQVDSIRVFTYEGLELALVKAHKPETEPAKPEPKPLETHRGRK